MSDVMQVTESLRRCYASDGFFGVFFDSLIKRRPQVVTLFEGADEVVLRNFLRNALTLLLMDATGSPHAKAKIAHVHQRHSPGDLDIDPAWFPDWTESLLQAVRASDPKVTADLERAWRRVIEPGVRKVTP